MSSADVAILIAKQSSRMPRVLRLRDHLFRMVCQYLTEIARIEWQRASPIPEYRKRLGYRPALMGNSLRVQRIALQQDVGWYDGNTVAGFGERE
jgi:hypothetical protein